MSRQLENQDIQVMALDPHKIKPSKNLLRGQEASGVAFSMDKSPLDDAVLDELERAGQMNMQKVKSNNSQKKDVLEVAGDLGINSVDDDQSSNVSLQIPVLSATAAMKFVEKEAQ